MITFYLEAKPGNQGRIVELRFYNGTHAGAKQRLGSVVFNRLEWEAFRPLLVAGMRLVRVPIELMDGTRREHLKGTVH